MSTFLESHYKFHQLESRLKKNQYLSNQCLPNFVDAQVFKALKTTQKIPKRQIYPNFYHWYILMRQFADRSLQIWIKDHELDCLSDRIITEVLKIINDINRQNLKISGESEVQISVFQKAQRQNLNSFLNTSTQKQSASDSVESPKHYLELPKVSSHIEKKSNNQYDSVTEYIMDIKLSSGSTSELQNVRRFFQIQTVKLNSIRVISGAQDQFSGSDVRVYFLTISNVCEQLKNQILRCSNVQTIQCKKQKRNQSL